MTTHDDDGASAPVTETDPGAEAEANGKADVATDFTGGMVPSADLPRDVRDAVAFCGVRDEVLLPGPLA